jgi:hypothetical protein
MFYDADKKIFTPASFPVNERFEFYKKTNGYKNDGVYKEALNTWGGNNFDIPIP